MITLKEALKLNKNEIKDLRKDLEKKIIQKNEIKAYVEQFTNENINTLGEGVPIAIKDNIQVKGWEVTCGSNILKGYIAPYNATVIEKLLENGLSPFGRCNMDEFAMGSSTESSCYGATKNPRNLNYTPGGSSGGSAAAVAGGIAIAALGSDTGGSIRQPASYCGCVGMKPSYGKVSRYGLSSYSSSLDQIGPITQNVEDAAILFDIISGGDEKDSTSFHGEYKKVSKNINGERKLTIAVIENFLQEASLDVQKEMKKAILKLENFGHKIVYKKLLSSKYDVSAYYILATAEASTNLSKFDGVRYGRRAKCENFKEMFVKTRNEGFGDEVKRRILLGTFVLSSGYYDAYYVKAQKARHLIRKNYEAIFNEADLIFMPVTPDAAFKFGKIKDPLKMYLGDIFTISVNLAGLPAISLPIGKNDQNLPIAAQFIAKLHDEQTLFDGAKSLENILS